MVKGCSIFFNGAFKEPDTAQNTVDGPEMFIKWTSISYSNNKKIHQAALVSTCLQPCCKENDLFLIKNINFIDPKEPYKIVFLLRAISIFFQFGPTSSATAEQIPWILIRTCASKKDNKQVWRAGSHSQSLSDRRPRLKCVSQPRRPEGSCSFSLWISSEYH